MSRPTRVALATSLVFTVYLVYLVGCAALLAREGIGQLSVVPFVGMLDARAASAVLNWSAAVALLSWVHWGWRFVQEGK